MSKKAIKNYIFLLLTIFFEANIQAQTIESILDKVEQKYKSEKSYKIHVDYSLYKGISENENLRSFSGEIVYHNKTKYNKIQQTEFIVDANEYIKVNHKEKALIYYKKNRKALNNNELDIVALLKVLDKEKLTENKNYWICEMKPKKNTIIQYSKIKLLIDKETFTLKKQVMILNRKISLSKTKEKLETVRLVIDFGPIEKITKKDLQKIKINRFIIKRENKVSLTKQYNNYQLILNN